VYCSDSRSPALPPAASAWKDAQAIEETTAYSNVKTWKANAITESVTPLVAVVSHGRTR